MNDHQTRRCIVCGRRENKRELARFAKRDERLVFDAAQTELGRGVYAHPIPECFSRLTDVRLWKRSLSRNGGDIQRESILGAIDDARAVLKIEFSLSPEGGTKRGR